jgi:hypothetical protein
LLSEDWLLPVLFQKRLFKVLYKIETSILTDPKFFIEKEVINEEITREIASRPPFHVS